MLLSAALFKLVKNALRDDGCGACDGSAGKACVRVGEVENGLVEEMEGRCDTQSWTSRETRGFEVRLCVFLVPGCVVITMTGPEIAPELEMLVGGRGYGLIGR